MIELNLMHFLLIPNNFINYKLNFRYCICFPTEYHEIFIRRMSEVSVQHESNLTENLFFIVWFWMYASRIITFVYALVLLQRFSKS